MYKLIGAIISLLVFVLICIFAYMYNMNRAENLNTARAVVTLHYADWCPHCRNMKPIWQQVKAQLKSSHPDIVLRENDEDKKQTPGINGIPTILLTDRAGKTYKYPGGPDVVTLGNWIIAPVH